MLSNQEKMKILASLHFLDNLLHISYKYSWQLVFIFLPEGLTAFYPKSIASRTERTYSSE